MVDVYGINVGKTLVWAMRSYVTQVTRIVEKKSRESRRKGVLCETLHSMSLNIYIYIYIYIYTLCVKFYMMYFYIYI